MRFGLSPQLTQTAQNEAGRTILPFAAETPTPAVVGTDPTAIVNAVRQLRDISATGHSAAFAPPDLASTPPPAPQARGPQPKTSPVTGISDAVRLGTDLFGQVGQRRLVPDLAFKKFALGLASMNISHAAAVKLTETFAVSLQKAAAQRGQIPTAAVNPAPLEIPVGAEQEVTPPLLDLVQDVPAHARDDSTTSGPEPVAGLPPLAPGVVLEALHGDPASLVATDAAVQAAREAFERAPGEESSFRLSDELIEAQERRGIPADSRTPLTTRETRQWVQLVLGIEPGRRPEAIRRLAMRLQEMHGGHADLALRSVARRLEGDASSKAFAEALIERMDDVRILARVRTETLENTPPEIAPLTGSFPALNVDPSRADRLAARQGTPAIVRDSQGNFVRGAPLSEAVQVGDAVGFVEPVGKVHLVDGNRHVVLFDDDSGRWLVFNRTFVNDELDRATVLPVAANERTGELSLGLPELAKAFADAVIFPGDVQDGFVDPLSEEGIRRSFEFGGSFSPMTAARATRQFGTAMARRAAERDTVARTPDGTPNPVRPDSVVEPSTNAPIRDASNEDASASPTVPQRRNAAIADDTPVAVESEFGLITLNEWTRFTDFRGLFGGGSEPGVRAGLRKNMLRETSLALEQFTGWRAHHIVPWDFREIEILRKLNFDFNHPNNGVPLPEGAAGTLSPHPGSHAEYSKAYLRLIKRLARSNARDNDKVAWLAESIERTRQILLSGRPPITISQGGTEEAWSLYFGRLGDDLGLPPGRPDD